MEMQTEAPSVMDAGYAVADRLMLALPTQWIRSEIGLGMHNGELEVSSSITQFSNARPEWSVPVDPRAAQKQLAQSFELLRLALSADGVEWELGGAEVERRGDGPICLDLFDYGEKKQVIAHLEMDPGDLLFGDELLQALHEGQPKWEARQRELVPWLENHVGWSLHLEQSELELEEADGNQIGARMEIVGSWSKPYESFRWSWADKSYGQVPALVSGTQLAERAEAWPGQGVLCTPGFDCDAILADALAMLAADHLGGYPVYFGRMPDLTVFVAITGPLFG